MPNCILFAEYSNGRVAYLTLKNSIIQLKWQSKTYIGRQTQKQIRCETTKQVGTMSEQKHSKRIAKVIREQHDNVNLIGNLNEFTIIVCDTIFLELTIYGKQDNPEMIIRRIATVCLVDLEMF